jgi:2-octaprenyl-6-methoxyphenol hydroxylase
LKPSWPLLVLPEHAPLVIAGGGPVGAALALGLRPGAIRPVLLEARPAPAAFDDARFLAISFGSRLILERLGVWSEIERCATAIRSIEVSQLGGFGCAVLDAKEVGLPVLGHVVRYRDLVRILAEATRDCALCATGVSVRDVKSAREFAAVSYERGDQAHLVSTALVAIADGGQSLAARGAPFASLVHDYRQCAVVAWVRAESDHGNRAFERFTPSGPAALLPAERGYSVVLTLSEADATTLCDASDSEFLAHMRKTFGDRAAALTGCTPRSRFPLALRYAEAVTGERVALIGNAAQMLHPVAGQGFNLGLRDAWTLARIVLDTPRAQVGSRAMLARYRSERARDRTSGILLTDALVRLFSNDRPWLRRARGLGLTMLDFSGAPKHLLMRRMMFGA